MNEKRCKDCAFFKKHYILRRKKYVETGFGHCSNGELRHKPPERIACPDFVEKQVNDESAQK